jgi:glycosyltransferase involved in cell wall biosynthesis
MNDLPLVSIITPSYNQARFIETTLRSVLEQSYPRVEYLVADGGSSDGSVEIIRKYAAKLTWWVSEKDNGQADAINKGFARCKGDIVGWVNSDDYYLPGALEEVVETFRKNPGVGLVFGDVRVVDENDAVINELHYGNWGIRDLMSFHIIGQPAVFFRRSVLKKTGGLDLSYHLLLDHQLWLRMALENAIKYHPSLWAGAHYHADCKNLALASQFGEEAHRIVDWMKTEPAFAPYLSGQERRIEAGAERLNAFYLLDAGMSWQSFRSYWRAFWLHPTTVLPEWYRMLYTLAAPLGLEKLKAVYLEKRRRKFRPG